MQTEGVEEVVVSLEQAAKELLALSVPLGNWQKDRRLLPDNDEVRDKLDKLCAALEAGSREGNRCEECGGEGVHYGSHPAAPEAKCLACDGTGKKPATPSVSLEEPCKRCQGHGFRWNTFAVGLIPDEDAKIPCPDCSGTGKRAPDCKPPSEGEEGEEERIEEIASIVYAAMRPGWPPFDSIPETQPAAREIKKRLREVASEVMAVARRDSRLTKEQCIELLTSSSACQGSRRAVPEEFRGISTVDLIAGLRAAFQRAAFGEEQADA